jgi:hypothetical protein
MSGQCYNSIKFRCSYKVEDKCKIKKGKNCDKCEHHNKCYFCVILCNSRYEDRIK